MLKRNARLMHCLVRAASIFLAAFVWASASAQVASLAGDLQICQAENPSSAFNITQSETDANGDYWMAYACKAACSNWRECQMAANAGGGGAKRALAFVVDGMGGHFSFTTEQSGQKTVLLHTGAGGTNFMHSLARQIESASDAKVVMVRWEYGFSGWGWFTRTSAPATRVPRVTRRIASVIAWVHENLAGASDFGTVGCSMGTQATLGAVYWHDVDSLVDYQLMVGGPGLWDINAGCGRRSYASGHCDLDASRACSGNADCSSLSARSRCVAPGPIPLAGLYESVVNHVHATQACKVSQAASSTPIYAPFDESGFGFTAGDWDFDHPIDFQMDLWGSDGDSRWAMGDAMHVFNSIASASGHEKRWNTTKDSNHCAAIGDGKALQLLMAGMNLGRSAPPPPPPPPPPNRPPEPVEPFSNLQLASGEELEVALGGKFRDEGTLRYSAESSAPSVASARVVGNALRVRGLSPGRASITVTATDNAGLSAQQSFETSVGWLLSFADRVASVPEGGVARLRLALNRPAAAALSFAWRARPDEDAASADADAEDLAVAQGTLAFREGETEAFIEMPVLDDEDIEPAREQLLVELLPPPPETDAALVGTSALVEIQEGVCDRSPQVRDALRGAEDCWAPTPAQLAARRELDLRSREIHGLRSGDLLGLAGLRALRLQENRLAALPPSLFAGVSTLLELNLEDNPGAPFVFTMLLARTDAAQPWAESPAQVAARVAEGAPFPMSARILAVGADLSAGTASIPAGQVAGQPIRASATGEGAARLSLAEPSAVPATMCGNAQSGRHLCFQGVLFQAGPPLALFKRPPAVAVAEPPEIALTANGDRARLQLTPLFVSRGETLRYQATSDNPALVAVRIEGETLVLDANVNGDQGVALIAVTAMDWAGQSATLSFRVAVEFAPPRFWRSWRLGIPKLL